MKLYIDITIGCVVALLLIMGAWKTADMGMYLIQHVSITWTP